MFYKVLFILTVIMFIRDINKYVKECKKYVATANDVMCGDIPITMYLKIGDTQTASVLVVKEGKMNKVNTLDLEKLSTEELRSLLYERASAEKMEFCDELRKKPSEYVMEMAYQHTIYDEYLSLLEQDYLNEEQIKFLLQFECPLSVCYDAWLKTDVSYMEILHVAVNNLTEGLIADDTI